MTNRKTKTDIYEEDASFLLENTKPCPKCRNPIQKNAGCNHMTCAKCNSSWCWICGGKIRGDSHFSSLNIFGCPGGQFDDNSSCCQFMLKIFLLIGIPFMLLFGPPIFLAAQSIKCWGYRKRCKSLAFFIVFFLIQFPLSVALGLVAGVLAAAILCVPAMLF